jgi:NodT family efflux transporter outer membrane factor (OMF) lipoprotein
MDLPGIFIVRNARWMFLSGVLLLTSACNIGPKYARPVTPVAPAFKEPAPPTFAEIKGWKVGEPRDNLIRGKWWEIFGDPALSALEEQIDAGSQTLAAAEAQYRASQATIRVTRAGLYPTLTGGASLTGTGVSGSTANSRGATQSSLLVLPTVGASWVPDLWGQVRKTIAGNIDTAQASAANMANVRLALEGELALDYYQLHGLDAQKQLLDTTIKAYQNALDLTVNRYNQGVASQVDVAQAQTQLQQTTAQSTDTLVLRQQYEHAIAVLVGKPPSEFSVPVSEIKVDPPGIPFGVPSELLERRPDIAQNERIVAAANEQIGIALTAYYPTLTLGASGGLEGSSIVNLFTWPSRFWTLGPSLAETILDFGKRRGITEQAQANYDAAAANYRQTVLTAFQQVEDNLAALRVLDLEAKQQAEAIRYADRSLELANNQYQGGITAYLQVIQAQEIALSNEVTGVQLKTRRMMASVSLVQALGGGWDASELPSRQETMPKSAKTAMLR